MDENECWCFSSCALSWCALKDIAGTALGGSVWMEVGMPTGMECSGRVGVEREGGKRGTEFAARNKLIVIGPLCHSTSGSQLRHTRECFSVL